MSISSALFIFVSPFLLGDRLAHLKTSTPIVLTGLFVLHNEYSGGKPVDFGNATRPKIRDRTSSYRIVAIIIAQFLIFCK